LWNQASCNGGGYYTVGDEDAYIVNSIFYYNSSDVLGSNQLCINSINCGTYITNCDIQNGVNGISGHPELMVPPYYINNLEDYPEFVDDYNNFTLLENSPCIDTGTLELSEEIELPEYDIAGNSRVYGTSVDIGCYEWQGVAVHESQIHYYQNQLSNYPNPFNPSTTIEFRLGNELNEQDELSLSIYNLKGQKVKTLPVSKSQSHTVSVVWNGTDDYNKSVSSGIYFYKLKAGDFEKTKKCLLMK
jgi:hypothetical protein